MAYHAQVLKKKVKKKTQFHPTISISRNYFYSITYSAHGFLEHVLVHQTNDDPGVFFLNINVMIIFGHKTSITETFINLVTPSFEGKK